MLKASNVIVVALVALVAAVHPVHAAVDDNDNVLTENNLFIGILDFIASPVTNTVAGVVEGSCDFVNDLLFNHNSSDLKCDCDGSFTVSNGLDLDVNCGFEEDEGLCLFGFCGFPTLEATITPTGFEMLKLCVEFEDKPWLFIPALDPFCFTGYGIGWFSDTPFAFDSCEVELNNTACECTVCENEQSFKYDCSMNTMYPNTVEMDFLPDTTDGPKMDICLGVGTFEEIWSMVFPPPPTPLPSTQPSASVMPSTMPSVAPSASPSAVPTSSHSPTVEGDSGDSDDGCFLWVFC